jgi:hypothetical protein
VQGGRTTAAAGSQEKGMSNEEREEEAAPERGLGFSHLAMNEIAASKTEEPSEVARRSSVKWGWIIAVLAVVGAGAWLLRSALNLPPSTQVQQQFEQSPAMSAAMEQGWVHRVTFVSGSKVRIDFSPLVGTTDEAGRKQLREFAAKLMDALIAARPGRDLDIIGFQDDSQMLQAHYRDRSTLVGRGGEPTRDLVIHVKGDPQGGIVSAMPAKGVAEQ